MGPSTRTTQSQSNSTSNSIQQLTAPEQTQVVNSSPTVLHNQVNTGPRISGPRISVNHIYGPISTREVSHAPNGPEYKFIRGGGQHEMKRKKDEILGFPAFPANDLVSDTVREKGLKRGLHVTDMKCEAEICARRNGYPPYMTEIDIVGQGEAPQILRSKMGPQWDHIV